MKAFSFLFNDENTNKKLFDLLKDKLQKDKDNTFQNYFNNDLDIDKNLNNNLTR